MNNKKCSYLHRNTPDLSDWTNETWGKGSSKTASIQVLAIRSIKINKQIGKSKKSRNFKEKYLKF